MRHFNTICCALMLLLMGCESAPAPDESVEEPPNIPTISAAPDSKKAGDPAMAKPVEAPSKVAEELAVAEDEDEPEDAMKQGAPRSRIGELGDGLGAGGLGVSKSGSGAGRGGGGASSVAGLLEARGPGKWRVRLVKTDGDAPATRAALQKKGASFDRCLTFLGKDVKKLNATITYANNAASEVTTAPEDKTVGECIRSQVGRVRLTSPATLQLEFNR